MLKYVLLVSFMDSVIFNLLVKLLNIMSISTTFYHLLIFIPFSFIYEILFDLLHYCAHLLLHKNKKLYIYHKTHHFISHPSSIYAFYQHPIDYFITNTIPLTITTYILQPQSLFIFILLLTYKTHIEIGGHCGKNNKTPSFPQCIWLPRMFGIELYTTDHDKHHTLNNCNYTKRFSLWDKIFKIYK
jgi:sterol desaturase/sphingolipid hydroxylase (fatty acid hydroxylase superfamily)